MAGRDDLMLKGLRDAQRRGLEGQLTYRVNPRREIGIRGRDFGTKINYKLCGYLSGESVKCEKRRLRTKPHVTCTERGEACKGEGRAGEVGGIQTHRVRSYENQRVLQKGRSQVSTELKV